MRLAFAGDCETGILDGEEFLAPGERTEELA